MHTTTTTTTRVGVTRCGNWQWRSRTSGVRRVRTLYQENNTSFSERELVRLSVVCLSVTFVHPTQATDGVTLFFRQKIDDLFSHTSRSQKVATPTLILILPIDRFSFVKFSRKKCDFHQCVTPPWPPGWCHPVLWCYLRYRRGSSSRSSDLPRDLPCAAPYHASHPTSAQRTSTWSRELEEARPVVTCVLWYYKFECSDAWTR